MLYEAKKRKEPKGWSEVGGDRSPQTPAEMQLVDTTGICLMQRCMA